jgi:nucleotide-binding universal stress UspA family protein
MYERIIAPLDGTRFAEAALAPARELANRFGSRILVVRAVAPARFSRTSTRPDGRAETERLNDCDAYLHEIVGRLRVAGYTADLLLDAAGTGASFTQAAELSGSDLVVMAAHLRWSANPLDGDSVTLHLLDRSAVPVLVWHDRRLADGQAVTVMHTGGSLLASADAPILVPLDGSRFAEQALPTAETLAHVFGAPLVLVRTIDSALDPLTYVGSPAQIEPDYEAADRATVQYLRRASEAREYLARVRDGLALRGERVEVAVRTGAPFAAIEAVRREKHAGLIVLATHSHAWFMGRFLSSVAAAIIEHVEAPVLVLRPEDARLWPEAWMTVSGERPLVSAMGT